MSETTKPSHLQNLIKRIAASCGLSWLDLVAEGWRFGRKLWEDFSEVGMYEVLHHEATFELKNAKGKKATLTKEQKVRYLQNHIIAYQDQAWGDGEILVNYKCSPGIEVDRYKPAETTFILISLRETKRRGDIDNFHISWDALNAFTRNREVWATKISHRTKSIALNLIFPKSRPPIKAKVTERLSRKVFHLDSKNFEKRADGNWAVRWETKKVRVDEQYLFEWEW